VAAPAAVPPALVLAWVAAAGGLLAADRAARPAETAGDRDRRRGRPRQPRAALQRILPQTEGRIVFNAATNRQTGIYSPLAGDSGNGDRVDGKVLTNVGPTQLSGTGDLAFLSEFLAQPYFDAM
jgi:hypothetical protein